MPTRMREAIHAGWHRAWLAVGFLLALSSGAMAQDYPSRTIKMIVPTGAGGITDILARLVGKSISEQLGQPVIIDNRTGAGGTGPRQAIPNTVFSSPLTRSLSST